MRHAVGAEVGSIIEGTWDAGLRQALKQVKRYYEDWGGGAYPEMLRTSGSALGDHS